MIYLQIIISLFIAVILIKLFRQRQANKISLSGFVIWFLLWLAVAVTFWQPDATTYLANWLGIGRGSDLVIYLSVLAIFYLLFRIFVRLNKIDSEITKIVRKDALKDDKKR
jgi:hypothetical protein